METVPLFIMPAVSPTAVKLAADIAAVDTPTPAPTAAPTTQGSKPQRRKLHAAARHRRGRRHDDDEDEAGTEESYTDDDDDSGLSEDDASLLSEEEDTEDEYEEEEAGTPQRGTEKKKKGVVTDTEIMRRGIRAVRGGEKDGKGVDYEEFGKVETAEVKVEKKEGEGENEDVADGEEKEERSKDREEKAEEEGKVGDKGAVEAAKEDWKPQQETPFERRRREHEEYKKRRAEDPAFVPNRGRFFMHDHREGSGSNGFRPFGPGGRGRGFAREPQPPSELAADRWEHDMHEQADPSPRQPPASVQTPNFPARVRPTEQPRSFGRIVHKGTVQIQVNLPGMKSPITFSEVPWKSYTRLPFHRPPLRRDKPVRVALPGAPVRYIYPTVARSFIFIPRAMRPGGSGYGRGQPPRGRGGFIGGFPGSFAAGRSMYGGSTGYSPSIGMSRRSSIVAYDTRQHTPSAATQHFPPPQPAYIEEQQTRAPVSVSADDENTAKPVVRLPTAAAAPPVSSQAPPSQAQTQRNMPSQQQQPHPPPYRETRATPNIPMHQPRPQKNINVAELDSAHYPGAYQPAGYASSTTDIPPPPPPHLQQQQQQYPPQSYQPQAQYPATYPPQQQQPFYPPPPQQQYLHPNPTAPHFIPHPQPHPQPSQYIPASPVPAPGTVPMQSGTPVQGPTTIAQESNGMVFYSTWDPNCGYYPPPPQMQQGAYGQGGYGGGVNGEGGYAGWYWGGQGQGQGMMGQGMGFYG
ncbi:hypothetical protein EX30DRAFT_383336 [Ascodesmis nigricans]|uniref:Btz domain-containing protein n=1 Tax=Ascodesmis nigricans TaxID=341454 RepID=A0A4S2MNX8_9PEZI|nr:hypothetical protein EX30DRAFT_383336 [Ascodesmis nigricans]